MTAVEGQMGPQGQRHRRVNEESIGLLDKLFRLEFQVEKETEVAVWRTMMYGKYTVSDVAAGVHDCFFATAGFQTHTANKKQKKKAATSLAVAKTTTTYTQALAGHCLGCEDMAAYFIAYVIACATVPVAAGDSFSAAG